MAWDPKDPDEVLDYQIDWSARLGQDTIQTSTWTVPTGLTQGADSFDGTTATIWLSGGTLGKRYKVENRITTAGGRTMDMSAFLKIRSK